MSTEPRERMRDLLRAVSPQVRPVARGPEPVPLVNWLSVGVGLAVAAFWVGVAWVLWHAGVLS